MLNLQKTISCTLLALTALSWSVLSADAKVYIDISPPAAKKLSIAVPTLVSEGGEAANAASKVTQVMTQDLEVSGAVTVLQKATYPKEPLPEPVDFKSWTAVGAEAVVKGRMFLEGGKATADVRLYDAAAGRQLMAARYIGDPRKVAHTAADDIIAVLTGERGAFNTTIAIVSDATGSKEIYLMDYDGEGVEALTKNGSINLSPSWSPDGSAVSFVSFKDGRAAVYIKDIAGGRESRIPVPAGGSSIGASWSPDGRRLAVAISREGNADIYTVNRDGSGLTRLTDGWGLDLSPSWSPDGREIAFVSDRGGTPQIYVMDSSGKNARRLTFEGSYNVSPAWSPKGGKIAFSGTREGRFEIFTIDPDGNNLTQLTANAGNNETPTWSPDGRFIAFGSTREARSSIYMMYPDGSGQRKIAATKGNATGPCWGPRVKE